MGMYVCIEIPDYLTCLLRNLYSGQEATVRLWHGKMDWFKTGKGVCQGCILSSCLFNLYVKYIIWNTGMDDSQAGIKITGRNINNLKYADDTTLIPGAGNGNPFQYSCLENFMHRRAWNREHDPYSLGVTESWTWLSNWAHHFNGRNWRGTKEPSDEGERKEWKSWL